MNGKIKNARMTRIFSVLLSLAMLASCIMVPVSVSAAYTATEVFTGDDFSDAAASVEAWSGLAAADIAASGNISVSGASSAKHYPVKWGENNKPLKVSFTASNDAEMNAAEANYGFHFYLLDADTASTDANDVVVTLAKYRTTTIVNGWLTNGTYADGTVDSGMNATATTGTWYRTFSNGRNNTQWWTYNNFVWENGAVTVTAEYDWSKWDAEDTVVISLTMADADASVSNVISSTITYKYTGENKPETFNIGFENSSAVTSLDDIKVDSIYSQANAFVKDNAAILAKTTDTAVESDHPALNAALADYNELDAKAAALLTEEKALLDSLKAKLSADIIANFDGTDDFSNADKTAAVWTNALSGKIVDGAVILGNTDKDLYVFADTVWGENSKPSTVSFTALSDTGASRANSTALMFYLLKSDKSDAYLNIGNLSSSSGTFFGPYDSPDDTADDGKAFACTAINTTVGANISLNGLTGKENHRGWWFYSQAFNAADGALKYTAQYDWSKWDSEDTVVITVTAEDADGLASDGITAVSNVVTTEFTYAYMGEAASKPETFNIGFQNLSGNSTVDNVAVEILKPTVEEPDYTPEIKGATIKRSGTQTIGFKCALGDIREDKTIAEYGMIVTANSYINNGLVKAEDMTADTSNDYVKVVSSKEVSALTSGYEFTANIGNISSDNYGVRYVVRVYVKYVDGDDEVIDYSETSTKSVISVAKGISSWVYNNYDAIDTEYGVGDIGEVIESVDGDKITYAYDVTTDNGAKILEYLESNNEAITNAYNALNAL